MPKLSQPEASADIRLFRGDCLEVMSELADGSVDAIVTDPPYGLTQLAWDGAIDWPAWWDQAKRVRRTGCPIVLFAQQPFATDLIQSNRREFKYDLVWAKNLSTGFLDANRRPLRSHELVLVFGKSKVTFNRIDWARSMMNLSSGTLINKFAAGGDHYGTYRPSSYVYGPNECPKSLLRFKRTGNSNARNRADHHPTAKPLDMMEWLVKSYSAPGATVLDPFMGSGTTGLACVNTGRRFVGIERDAGYFAQAERRIADARAERSIA